MNILFNFSQKYIGINTEKVKVKSLSRVRLFGTPLIKDRNGIDLTEAEDI